MVIYLGCRSLGTSSDLLEDIRRAAGALFEKRAIPICLAPSGVYLAGALPRRWWALTPPLHPHPLAGAVFISVALA
jgi:hypothetical protein